MGHNIAIIGFGEAGSTFAASANWRGQLRAFDTDPGRKRVIEQTGAAIAHDAESAVREASIVLSLVTADQALVAAEDDIPLMPAGAIWADFNSVAPDTKRKAERIALEHGVNYVDVAVLAPVQGAALSVPLLLSGPAADDASMRLGALGFTNITIVGERVGEASAIKMIRSVMVKGIEALTGEMMQAAEAAGVTDLVLASLDDSEKPMPWAKRAAYNQERMATHGLRRATEMEEVAKTLLALGVDPVMTNATIMRQRAAASPAPETKPAPNTTEETSQ